MAEEGTTAPRRALEPLPDDANDASAGRRSGSRAFADDGPSPSSPGSSGGRRGRFALSPLSPQDPLDVDSSTPVPPPVPVLPDSEAGLAPSAGRRYSASMEPGEVSSAAPRRSAATAASPASALEPHLRPLVRPTAPPPVTVQGPKAPQLPPPPPVVVQAAATATPALPTPRAATAALPSGSSPTPLNAFPRSVATAPTAPSDAPTIVPPVRTGTSEPSFFSRSEPTVASGKATPAEAASKPEKASRPPRVPREKVTREKKVQEPKGAVLTVDSPAGSTEVPSAGVLKGRSSRPALIVIAAVAAVVVVVAGVVWALTLRSTASSGGPTAAGTAQAQDPFVTAADLGALGGATWVDPGVDTAGLRPLCLPAAGDALPEAQRSASNKVTASSSPTDAVVQAIDTYADDATATQAYAARLAQVGTCADTVALITGANTISGLADSAEVIRLTVQEQTNQFHSLLISRTGRSVSLIDVTSATAVTPSDLANVAAAALGRGCGGQLGTCPGSISVATSLPPAGNPLGWLVPADLPRITPGSGRWGATEPKTTLDVVGSLCEAINLKSVAGTQAVGQRTLLLADDSNAPQGFGVDQVVYTFADAGGVANLAKRLDKNLTGCPDRAPTATVKEGPAVKGTGVNAVKISGSTYEITQKTGTNTVVFRVAVMSVNARLVYLLANPSTSFDFADSDWSRVALRAGQRASQSS